MSSSIVGPPLFVCTHPLLHPLFRLHVWTRWGRGENVSYVGLKEFEQLPSLGSGSSSGTLGCQFVSKFAEALVWH
jgi:hypothetical protein